jgi:hypothetical protein
MSRFSSKRCIAHGAEDVTEFVSLHLKKAASVLFIGTVGIETSSLYFPDELAASKNVQFRFFVERRSDVSDVISDLGLRHQDWLSAKINDGRCQFFDVPIILVDGATAAGRNAVNTAAKWYDTGFSDIVVDSSGMSRGVCFPVIRQAIEMGELIGANVHLLVASNDQRMIQLISESNDRADWMHGFQGKMGLDSMAEALQLWIPQLAEGGVVQMNIIHSHLSASAPVAEVCPIVPFPSLDPRRGDELLFEYREAFQVDWGNEHLNVIYAHEADPMDVFRSITRMEFARREVFAATGKVAVSILSPSGWRIGSLGMVLAAIDLELPMLYVETIGYTTDSTPPSTVVVRKPERLWHIWLAGTPYANTLES